MSLKQRIQSVDIKIPYAKNSKDEYLKLPASSRKLFKKAGTPWDVLEKILKDEGWLADSECLWEVLSIPENLNRGLTNSSFAAVDLDVEDWEQDALDALWEDINNLHIEVK